MLTDLKLRLRRPLLPLARGLAHLGVGPDALTAAGLLAAVLAGAALTMGRSLPAVVLLLLSGLLDLLDGDVARLQARRDNRFGAVFDSTADRVAEICVLGGLLLGRVRLGPSPTWPWVLAWLLALTGGLLVSYARARAEGLGIECRVGVADRGVRVALVAALLVAGARFAGPLLAVLAALSWITVVQRLTHVHRLVRRDAG
jgi:CDP-diacylglycerol--glycerol-3-phosphate 3-phosphatidyltransferase